MRSDRFSLLAPWAGVAFFFLAIIGAALMLWKIPDPEDSDAGIIDFYNDSTAHVLQIIGAYMWALAAVALLWFATHLRTLIREAEGGPGNLANFGFAGAIIFVLLSLVAASAFTAAGGAIEIGGASRNPDADWMRVLPQFGFGLYRIPAVWGAIVFIYTTSIVTMKTGVLPKWTARAGFVLALIPLILITPVPMLAIPIWVLCVSIALMRKQAPSLAS
jgi:hypothetical protein